MSNRTSSWHPLQDEAGRAATFLHAQADGGKLSHFETSIHCVSQEAKTVHPDGSFGSRGARFLLESQNPDGGWGFQAALSSATEPTAWAVTALGAFDGQPQCRRARESGLAWLANCQRQDGSWPARPGQRNGCWVTSIACLAMAPQSDTVTIQHREELRKGLQWLSNDWPGEGSLWWRLTRMGEPKPESRRSRALRGWGWTPGTSSWIEPTAQALLALQAAPGELYPRGAQKRIQAAQALLLDRALTAGGWNSGGSDSYGYAGRPQPVPTAWALMALREQGHCPEVAAGLEGLRQIHSRFTGLFSLSLSCLCLKFWGIPYEFSRLEHVFLNGITPVSVMETAWALLAMSPPQESPLGQWRRSKS
ncbi:MAG: prenyltransferase/squalene oxidase repeat-containing protein [Terriglobia bacterium]